MLSDQSLESLEAQDIVYALAASSGFARDGVCFAARSSGLYRSDDGGLTWRSAFDSLKLQSPLLTTAVVLSPEFESDKNIFVGAQAGLLRSVDGGQNWQTTILPPPPPLVSQLIISPDFARDGVVLAGTMEDGVFRSADRGARWAAWNFGLLDLNVLCLAISPNFAQDETLFAGTGSGIFRSANGGRAWREVDLPTEFAPVLCLALSSNYAQDGILFTGTEEHGLFRSSDRGRTWTRLGEDVLTDTVNAIVLSPEFSSKPEVLALSGDRLLISRDGGQSWSDWKAGESLGEEGACMLAPYGLDSEASLLVGLAAGGEVRRI